MPSIAQYSRRQPARTQFDRCKQQNIRENTGKLKQKSDVSKYIHVNEASLVKKDTDRACNPQCFVSAGRFRVKPTARTMPILSELIYGVIYVFGVATAQYMSTIMASEISRRRAASSPRRLRGHYSAAPAQQEMAPHVAVSDVRRRSTNNSRTYLLHQQVSRPCFRTEFVCFSCTNSKREE